MNYYKIELAVNADTRRHVQAIAENTKMTQREVATNLLLMGLKAFHDKLGITEFVKEELSSAKQEEKTSV